MEHINTHAIAEEMEENRVEEEIIRHDDFSVEVMRFNPGDNDEMHSHGVQEVYHVDAGSAVLNVEGEHIDVEQGDLVHVEPGQDHAFQDFEGEFVVTVFYAPAAEEH